MQDKFERLKARLAQVSDLRFSSWLLGWDQRVMMPSGGAQTRADQLGTLAELAHTLYVDEEVGALLDDLSTEMAGMDPDSDEASVVRVHKREYEKQIRLPTDLVVDMAKTTALAREAWSQAREKMDFSIYAPFLKQVIDLQRRKARALDPHAENPYDALLDDYETGLDYASIDAVFSPLKGRLTDLIAAIDANQDAVDDSVVRGHFDAEAQLAFSREITAALGYDYDRGRLDLAEHPFTSGTGRNDARITTRVEEDFLPSCIMASIHEAGHGMHLQNTNMGLNRSGMIFPGLATAESQSRFYENVLGRSRFFWQVWYPRLQEYFPQMADVSFEAFYKALNKSQPSLIRVEADEVTYGMHIMLRFELENELINGRMEVDELPEAWNARMDSYLGVVPDNDKDGVMQDIHWSQGGFGYFPDYLLGSILSSQLWDKMLEEKPDIISQIEQGQYSEVLEWQAQKIHIHGDKFPFLELVERATGQPYTSEPYIDYLTEKYSEIYGL